jgi:hypothetical protein
MQFSVLTLLAAAKRKSRKVYLQEMCPCHQPAWGTQSEDVNVEADLKMTR